MLKVELKRVALRLQLINDVNPSLLRTSFLAPRRRKWNAARDATGLSIAKQVYNCVFKIASALINDVNPSLLMAQNFVLRSVGRKCNAARDATGLSIAKQASAVVAICGFR